MFLLFYAAFVVTAVLRLMLLARMGLTIPTKRPGQLSGLWLFAPTGIASGGSPNVWRRGRPA